jgi:ADP-heptose:LPS heptosyltransferase/GT2 family glycosyltransferase
VFFKEFDLLSQSGLFDANYYLAMNPDVAALRIDPLLHYLEKGAKEGRKPSAQFDIGFYLEQCRSIGEAPANPLLHYLTVGAGRGLRVSVAAVRGGILPDRVLYIDLPRTVGGKAVAPVKGSLSIAGWALASAGTSSIEVAVDGNHAAFAQKRIRRGDVAAAYPGRDDALLSGFAASIPNRLLAPGPHRITITLLDNTGITESVEFRIEVEENFQGEGAWLLRRKMAQAELDLQMRILAGLEWQPMFCVVLWIPPQDKSMQPARASLAALREQTYLRWHLQIVGPGHGRSGGSARDVLLRGFEDLSDRIEFLERPERAAFGGVASRRKNAGEPVFAVPLVAGDELGCDAFLEFAIAGGLDRGTDFFYSDERCINLVTKQDDAYFKSAWSPDLLLSSNYVGRAWCARTDVFERAGVKIGDWLARGDYDLVLRMTEAAKSIGHVPKILSQKAPGRAAAVTADRRALSEALRRRAVKAEVLNGFAAGIYRIKRSTAACGRVSIIIPTCGTRDYVKVCIDTLREKTAYRDFEIICVENIPAQREDLKRWLHEHADTVFACAEPFNWSRFNNLAAEKATGDFLLFLNDDVEIIEEGWLEALLEHGQRPEVGAVGARLLYPDLSVQHAGIALTGAVGTARHIFGYTRDDDPGYFGLSLMQRNVIGVTGACLLTRRDTFAALDGFDTAHSIINNDVDYCLRVHAKGLLSVITPYARLIHHESVSRAELGEKYDAAKFAARWRPAFLDGDPYFNPNLSRDDVDCSPEREPCRVIYASRPLFARQRIRRILVVKLDHIGDAVTALPAVRRLKRHFPQAAITVLSSRANRAVWAQQPEIDEIVEFDFFHARSALGLIGLSTGQLDALRGRLGGANFDLAVDLRKHPETRDILKYTGARHLAGFDYRNQFPWLDIALEWDGDVSFAGKRQPIGADLANLVDAIAASSEPADSAPLFPAAASETLPKAVLALDLFKRRVVAVHAGAGAETKTWPASYFGELIDLLIEREKVNIAIVGAPDEAEIARSVIQSARSRDSIFDLTGKLPVSQLPAFLSRCALFVGNDSGPKHIAAGIGIPTVGIHSGLTDAREWGPAGPRAVAIQRAMTCSPCYILERADCPRNLACLNGLRAGHVYGQCRRMLAMKVAAPPLIRPGRAKRRSGAARAGGRDLRGAPA